MNHEERSMFRFGSAGLLNYNEPETELKCPRCHSVMVPVCLTVNPPMYVAECFQCSFKIDAEDRKDPHKILNQGEVTEIYNKKGHSIGDRIG